MLGVTWTTDFTDGTDVPPTMDTDMSQMVALEACLMVTRVVAREGSINGFTVNGPGGVDFMVKFSTLEA